MRKPSLAIAAATTAVTIVIGHLFLQLRAERNTAAQLRQQLAQSPGADRSAGSASPAPRLANDLLQSMDVTGRDSSPTAPTSIASPSERKPWYPLRTAIPKELGLTPEEVDEFSRLLFEGGAPADFVALVGPTRYARYKELQRSTARGVQVNRLRTLLAATDHPLTDGQAAQLDQLLDAEQQRRAADDAARVRPSDPRALLDYDETTLQATRASNERVFVGAHGFLSGEQVQVLQSELERAVSQQLDILRTRRARLDAGGR